MNEFFCRSICSICLIVSSTIAVHAQGFSCPPGSYQAPAPGPGGIMAITCVCVDGQPAHLYQGCSSSGPVHIPGPPRIEPPTYDTTIGGVYRGLRDLLRRNERQLSPYESLTSSLQSEPRRSPPNPMAEQALQEMLTQRPTPAPAPPRVSGPPPRPPSGATGSLNSQGGIQAPGRQATTRQNAPTASTTPPGSYAACVGSSTFGAATPSYCEMGGYTYFRNGRVVKGR
jgi:hypothetical protein